MISLRWRPTEEDRSHPSSSRLPLVSLLKAASEYHVRQMSVCDYSWGEFNIWICLSPLCIRGGRVHASCSARQHQHGAGGAAGGRGSLLFPDSQDISCSSPGSFFQDCLHLHGKLILLEIISICGPWCTFRAFSEFNVSIGFCPHLIKCLNIVLPFLSS